MVSKEEIREEAQRLGFAFCGFAKAEPLDNFRSYYTSFIKEKGQASSTYLKTQMEKRLNPKLIMPDAATVIAVVMNYFPPEIIPAENNFIISKYAYGQDHHPFMRKKLKVFVDFLKQSGKTEVHFFMDSGNVLEKVWAQRCGVGWQGKNTILINRKGGSFFFIGIILTNLELVPDIPETDHCGRCNLCTKACPTGALDTPYRLNISRCLAYHTIESKYDIPEEIRSKQNDRIFGCDICQDVCPFNRRALPHNEPALLPSELLKKMRKPDWRKMTQQDFDRLFRKSSVRRAGFEKLRKNIPT